MIPFAQRWKNTSAAASHVKHFLPASSPPSSNFALRLPDRVCISSSCTDPRYVLRIDFISNPSPAESQRASHLLLQGSVVAHGFGMNLHEVLKAGRSGFIYTALGIGFALVVGLSPPHNRSEHFPELPLKSAH